MQEESGENLDIAMNARGANLPMISAQFRLADDGSRSGTGTWRSQEPIQLDADFTAHLNFQGRPSMSSSASRTKQDKATR